jgi:formyltetrahydrofolate synthetase
MCVAAHLLSVRFATMLIVCMLLTGKEPYAVSPDSMTASVPSRTAIEMSDTSARVGAGFLIIDSSMFVATMTGLPRLRQPCTLLQEVTTTWIGRCTRRLACSSPSLHIS